MQVHCTHTVESDLLSIRIVIDVHSIQGLVDSTVAPGEELPLLSVIKQYPGSVLQLKGSGASPGAAVGGGGGVGFKSKHTKPCITCPSAHSQIFLLQIARRTYPTGSGFSGKNLLQSIS